MWPKRNKYGNKRVSFDKYSFASNFEKIIYQWLKARETAGEVRVIKTQHKVLLTEAKIAYYADFLVLDLTTNTEFLVEAKGMDTDVWKIKKRLYACYGPMPLEIYKGSKTSFHLAERIVPTGTPSSVD